MCRRALSLTVRSSFGEKNFFVCRLGYCQYALCLFEKVTRFALLAFFPVMSHTRSICAAQPSAEVSRLARAAASRPPMPVRSLRHTRSVAGGRGLARLDGRGGGGAASRPQLLLGRQRRKRRAAERESAEQ